MRTHPTVGPPNLHHTILPSDQDSVLPGFYVHKRLFPLPSQIRSKATFTLQPRAPELGHTWNVSLVFWVLLLKAELFPLESDLCGQTALTLVVYNLSRFFSWKISLFCSELFCHPTKVVVSNLTSRKVLFPPVPYFSLVENLIEIALLGA